MNTADIENLLCALQFAPADTTQPDTWSRAFSYHGGYRISVNFNTRKIDYPDPLTVNDQTTSNFAAPENFVVLDCVCRLLEKGYAPEHLELERRYKIGHSGKSGKSDITVYDRDRRALLVIECKTWGEEYNKERNRTRADGGQLFSYRQQDAAIRWLCLYASREIGHHLEFQLTLIQIEDRPEVLELLQTNPDELAYQSAENAQKLHEVWKEQYSLFSTPNGLFDPEVKAYEPKKIAIKRRDLKPFTPDEGRAFYNHFAEILRHNNISDKSNAFNRILSLVLCKIVDEAKLPDEVTDFQIADIKEKPEAIQDRLQKLYADGMKSFLKEKIIYYSDGEIERVMNDFPLQHAKTAIAQMFRAQKYYSNNEFAFKEVHNEKLFLENARVLNELLQLLQHKQFRYNRGDDAQFKAQKRYLGEFFELLLAAGYKQDEGQFFTPLPIAHFIVSSLPLGDIVARKLKAKDPDFLPTVVDYACGSGHFLIEAIDQIQLELDRLETDYTDKINEKILHFQASDWTDGFIYGIEKDYRLARTAKLACFMNGDGEARITFGDGLEDYSGENGAMPATFDVLVANPPYSIKGFKTHTAQSLKRNRFDLMEHLRETSSEIETLFVERLKQLLHPGAVCGVILPSSILSNAGIYTRAREMLLRAFEIRAIVEFGSNTFMATGTNTITLFLKRRADKHAHNAAIVAHELIEENKARPNDFTDTAAILDGYAQTLGLEPDDYRSFLKRAPTPTLLESEWYVERRRAFEELASTKKLVASPEWNKKTPDQKTKKLDELFWNQLVPIERDKFEFYQLVWNQRTLIVRAPADGRAEKRWLGYDFSNRRGAEGINIYRENDKHQTALYDEDNADHPDKLNYLVRRMLAPDPLDYNAPAPSFPNVPVALEATARLVETVDCFDWTRLGWEKAFDTAATSKNYAPFQSKHSQSRFSQMAILQYGAPLPTDTRKPGDIPVVGSNGIVGEHDEALIEGPAIVVGRKGSMGKVTWVESDCFPIDTTFYVAHDDKQVKLRFLYHLLLRANLESLGGGIGVPGLNRNEVHRLKIPLPPLPVQQTIVQEIEAIEAEEESDRKAIETARAQIEARIRRFPNSVAVKSVGTLSKQKVEPDAIDPSWIYVGLEHIESGTGRLLETPNAHESNLQSTKNKFEQGDILYGKLRPYLNKAIQAPAEGVCSTDILVLKTKYPLLVRHALMHPDFVEQSVAATKGTQLPRLSASEFELLKVYYPGDADVAETELAEAEALIAAARARLDTIAARKNAVLAAHL